MNYLKLTLLMTAFALFMASCGGGEADNAVTMNDADSTSIETTQETSAPEGDAYELSLTGSTVNWKGAKVLVGSHNGTLSFQSGTLFIKDGKLVGGSFTIDMNSLND